jgi:hypothetical protein
MESEVHELLCEELKDAYSAEKQALLAIDIACYRSALCVQAETAAALLIGRYPEVCDEAGRQIASYGGGTQAE